MVQRETDYGLVRPGPFEDHYFPSVAPPIGQRCVVGRIRRLIEPGRELPPRSPDVKLCEIGFSRAHPRGSTGLLESSEPRDHPKLAFFKRQEDVRA